jgi:hypothetical protein
MWPTPLRGDGCAKADWTQPDVQSLRTSLHTAPTASFVSRISTVDIVTSEFETNYSGILDAGMRSRLQWYLGGSPVTSKPHLLILPL